MLRATLAPATYIILEKWNTVQYLKTITKRVNPSILTSLLANEGPRYRATTLTLIPSAIHQLVNHPDIKTTDLSSVNIIISGAAYLPPELAAQMKSFLNEKSVVEQGACCPNQSLAHRSSLAVYGLSESVSWSHSCFFLH